jgi:tRNA(His) guanylyltransferase
MKQEYEKIMRVFEENQESYFIPEMYIVSRLDGRGFSSLTKKMNYKKPFDENFSDVMKFLVKEIILNSGFNILYGYTQSDEISFLFKPGVDSFINYLSFGRRINKYNSILSSLSSSLFTFKTNEVVSFDCRTFQLPNKSIVDDYFKWRYLDAARNSLNSYSYYKLRETKSQKEANEILFKMNSSDMNELLFQNGINFNDIPNWQKRGTGFYWKIEDIPGLNPLTGEFKSCKRRLLFEDNNLPESEKYCGYIYKILGIDEDIELNDYEIINETK